MRRTLRASALVLSGLAAVCFAAACSGGGHHGATGSPTPTPAAPQNVAATAANATFHLRWDPVAGATGYKVFLSPTAITTTAGATPVFVPAPPYDATAPNWQPRYARVQAVAGALVSPLSAEVSATPTAGYLVANHSTGGTLSLDWFHADDGMMTDSIADGMLAFNGVLGTNGAIYTVQNSGHTATQEIGIATGASHVAYTSATTGHDYMWFGRVGAAGRILIVDHDTGANTYAVRTYAAAGGDPQVLKSGCSNFANYYFNASGIVFECDSGATYKEYVSDGVADGSLLTEGVLYLPVGLTADRIFFFDLNPTPRRSVSQLRASLATAPDVLFPPPTSGETDILYVGATRILVQNKGLSGTTYSVYSEDFAGGTNTGSLFSATTTPFVLEGVLPDQSAALLRGGLNSHAWLMSLDVGGSPVDVGNGLGNVSTATLTDGNITLARVPGSGWYATPQTGGTGIAFSGSDPAELRGAKGGWAVLDKTGSALLTAYSTTSTASHVLSTGANVTPIVFHSDLTVIWLDADGTTWVAKADGSLAPQLIDAAITSSIGDAGADADGRVFYTAHRNNGHVDTMRWTPGSGAAQIATGPGTEDGHYFAK